MLGLQPITQAVHESETIFKDPPDEWDRGTLDALFELAAAIRRAVDRLGTSEEDAALERVARLGASLRERGDGEAGPSDRGGGPAITEGDAAPVRSPTGPEDHAEVSGAAAGDQDESGAVAAAAALPSPAPSSAGEVVRVPFAGLNALLNRVGELVTLETRIDALLTQRRGALDAAGVRRPLEEAGERLARITGFLHETTMELRLVPIRRVFERFPSVARELARREGKRVRLEMEGEEVRIDKAMADEISEPLLHLVRNAVDHAFEPGREEIGTITLSARRAGDRLEIAVEDDGQGLDRAGIVAQARETGVIAPDEPFDEEDAGELILLPGFSTRGEATTVSGRGVGLDVVRRKAIALRGSLAVETPGSGGTRFVLDLPVTLAILPAVLFESDGETFAVPAGDVEETLRGVTLTRAGGAEVVIHRGEPVPAARPAELFGWGVGANGGRAVGSFAVVVRHGQRGIAILADRLLEQRDLVVKALPAYLGTVPAVSGATVTHEARVVLMLDAAGLLDLNLSRHRRQNRGR